MWRILASIWLFKEFFNFIWRTFFRRQKILLCWKTCLSQKNRNFFKIHQTPHEKNQLLPIMHRFLIQVLVTKLFNMMYLDLVLFFIFGYLLEVLQIMLWIYVFLSIVDQDCGLTFMYLALYPVRGVLLLKSISLILRMFFQAFSFVS